MTHILIVSLSRSGGKLLRMLLDGHSALNVFPFEHWHRRSKNSIPTADLARFAELSVGERLAATGGAHAERKLHRLHEGATVARIMEAWRHEAASAATSGDAYAALARAYFGTIGRSPDRPFVNHCGSLCRFGRDQLDAVFGAGAHVLTIRDPRAVFSSMQGLLAQKFADDRLARAPVSPAALARHRTKLEPVDGVSGYLREFCDDYRRMVAHYVRPPDVIRLRFEDLVLAPDETMRRVAAELGLDWEPALLTPSQLGAPHAANSSFVRDGGGIHAQAAGDWIGRLDPAVREYIEEELAVDMAALGYAPLAAAGQWVSA